MSDVGETTFDSARLLSWLAALQERPEYEDHERSHCNAVENAARYRPACRERAGSIDDKGD